MKKLILPAIALIMALVCFVYIVIRGDSYEEEYTYFHSLDNTDDYTYVIEQDDEYIRLENFRIEGSTVRFTVNAVSPGKADVLVYGSEMSTPMFTYYVHKSGFITSESFLGYCTGGNIIIVMMILYAVILLIFFIRKFQRGIGKDFYSYHNITLLGMIIFISVIILNNTIFAINRNGLLDFIRGILSSTAMTVFLIPVAMLVALGIFISNIVLIFREGANKKNILGTVFSFVYLLFLIFPFFFEGFLQMQDLIDVHKETGFGHYLEIIVTNFCYSVSAYITMILIATVIMGIRAAHRIPAFDKDFILILGCRIRKDGQVTPLLKGRADAAIRFAKMQKKATGKEITFIPSGGKGSDEIISEAEAIKNYLISQNIDETKIIVEDNSSDTAENFRFSLNKIRESTECKEPKIAFATSGYHVFRSGYIASSQGIPAEGTGAGTKVYFWINAFIRELIATLYYEKKKHLLVVAVLLAAVTVMGSLLFFSIRGVF